MKVKVMYGSMADGFISNMFVSAINWCEDKLHVQNHMFGKYVYENEMRLSAFVLVWMLSGSCGILSMKVWHNKIVSPNKYMKAFENTMLKRIFFPKGEEVRKLHNEELHSFCTYLILPECLYQEKWNGQSMYRRNKKYVQNFEGNTMEGVCRRRILQLISVKWILMICTGLKWHRLSIGFLL